MLVRFIKSAEVRAVGSLGFLRYLTKGLSLLRLLILARFLSPGELGVFGLAVLVLAVSEVVTETGVNVILLKNPDRLKHYIHTAWAVSLARGGVIAAVILTLSGVVSSFFNTPQLLPYLWICALIALIKGCINPAIISFQQELRFEREALYRLPLQVTDLVVGLIFAWIWQSSIGLLVGLLAAACAEAVSSFLVFQQRPNLFKARWSELVGLYKETRVLVVNGIVNYLNEHTDDFLIGKVLGPVALGFYQTGYKFVSAVTIDFSQIIGWALLPVFAQRSGSIKNLRKTFWGALGGLCLVLVPIAVVSFTLAEPLVRVGLGEAWLPVAPVIPWLFLAAASKSFVWVTQPVAIVTNKVSWHLLSNSLVVILMCAAIFWLGPRYGLVGAAQGVAFAMIVAQPIIWFTTYRSLRKVAA